MPAWLSGKPATRAQADGPPSEPIPTPTLPTETVQSLQQDIPAELAVGALAVHLNPNDEYPQTAQPTELAMTSQPKSSLGEEIPRTHAPSPTTVQAQSLLSTSSLASATWTQSDQVAASHTAAPNVSTAGNAGSPESIVTQTSLPSTPVLAAPRFQLAIENARQGRGPVKVAVFTSPENFPDSRAAAQTLELASRASTLQADLSVNGTCAIAVYQDINGDGALTKNRFGIPIEPCGFSNHAVITRGPPSFAEAAVSPAVEGQPTIIRIHLP